MSLQTKPLPVFYVGKQVTKDRIKNFQDIKHPLLSQALGKQDTKCIWYAKEHFAKLLEEIEQVNGDGMRIHFGMYEEGHQFEGQLCLLFTATREKTIGNDVVHTNVFLENEPDFEDRSSLPRDFPGFPGDEPGNIRDFNYGSPCPPLCDGGGGDDDEESGS